VSAAGTDAAAAVQGTLRGPAERTGTMSPASRAATASQPAGSNAGPANAVASDRANAVASVAPAAARPVNRQPAHPAANSRYGESVVRELLGASFIEEQPHTPPTRFNRD
jgi:DNA polymerase-3 subunit gamma/tau